MTDSSRISSPGEPFRGTARLALVLAFLFTGLGTAVPAEEAAIPVIGIVVGKEAAIAQEFSLTGTVTPRRQARLSSRTAGLVAEVGVDAGSAVAEGDLLMTLDTRLADIALELIRAERAQSLVELEEAKRKAEEVRKLSETGGFAKSEAESLRADVRIRELQLRQLAIREEEQAEILERHRLVAPFEGVIARKLTEAGEWVAAGNAVLELVEIGSPRFDIQVPQEFLTRISRAEDFTVRLDAYPDIPLEAEVEVMVPVKDNVSRTFLTRLSLTDPKNFAAPGMSGSVEIAFRPVDPETVHVPRDAVVRFPDGGVKVWIVNRIGQEDRVSAKDVKTGASFGALTEIVEGLEGGETVVLKGNESLREDQKVDLRIDKSQPGVPEMTIRHD